MREWSIGGMIIDRIKLKNSEKNLALSGEKLRDYGTVKNITYTCLKTKCSGKHLDLREVKQVDSLEYYILRS
jgi:hypothetical protein